MHTGHRQADPANGDTAARGKSLHPRTRLSGSFWRRLGRRHDHGLYIGIHCSTNSVSRPINFSNYTSNVASPTIVDIQLRFLPTAASSTSGNRSNYTYVHRSHN